MIFVFPRTLVNAVCTKVLKAKSTFTLDLAEVSDNLEVLFAQGKSMLTS